MSIMKDLFIECYDEIISEMEEAGHVDEDKAGDMAAERSRDVFLGMCDEAKDRAKYAN